MYRIYCFRCARSRSIHCSSLCTQHRLTSRWCCPQYYHSPRNCSSLSSECKNFSCQVSIKSYNLLTYLKKEGASQFECTLCFFCYSANFELISIIIFLYTYVYRNCLSDFKKKLDCNRKYNIFLFRRFGSRLKSVATNKQQSFLYKSNYY